MNEVPQISRAQDGNLIARMRSSAAFEPCYLARDVQAGIITGAMAVPLSIGIAIMSEYPIRVGLATVAFASFVAWVVAWFRPGNYIGSPGIAAGLAPLFAMGVATFGLANMAFIVFITACMQAIIWRFNLQRFILKTVPEYLVEGMLAGIGLSIGLRFFKFTYEISGEGAGADVFFSAARIQIILISLIGMVLFVILFSRFRDRQPAVPYFVIILAGVMIGQLVSVPMVQIDSADIRLAWPVPDFASPWMWVKAMAFAAMLGVVDVVEQVMSNAAIEKIDPLGRRCDSNNSLLAIWLANLGASFFGGLKNLDGLAKSTTNRLAGAYTKFSVLIIGVVVTFFVINAEYLNFLPKFAVAIIMMFTAGTMMMRIWYVADQGPYALMLALLCGIVVFEIGIFEGLLIAVLVHGFINFLILSQAEKMSTKDIIRMYFARFQDEPGVD